MAIIKRNQAAIWSNAQNGKFAGYETLGIGTYGSEDATSPGPGQDSTYVQDENGNPLLAVLADTPPGGPPSLTLNFFEEYAKNHLRTARERGQKIATQMRFHRYGVLSNPTGWNKIFHYGEGIIGDETRPGARIDYTGEGIRGSMPTNYKHDFEYIRPQATALDLPDVVADALDVIFIGRVLKDVPAYPGPDKIGFVAMQAAAAATAKLYVTSDGGSTWAAATNDPFGADEHIASVRAFIINPAVGGRVVVQNASGAEVAYADFTWSDPTALTWTTVATTGNGTQLNWRYFKELLIATASGVYLSKDAGESIDSTLSANTNITRMANTPDDPNLDPYTYLFGASNTLLRKLKGSSVVDTLVGPTGGAAFTALAVAVDGTIWAGNGTSLYRSSDGGTTAAGWTQVKDFGAGKAVIGIGLVKNDPEFMQIFVDDSAPGDGEVWISADSVTFEPVTAPANDGYNAAYFSSTDPNLAYVVGDDDTTEPIMHKLAP